MVKQIHTIDHMKPNVFEAIKRALIKRGVVPLMRQPGTPTAEPKTSRRPKSKRPDGPEKVITHSAPLEAELTADKENSEQSTGKDPKNEKTLQEVAANVDDVLFEANTVFPFTLFPDTIKLDREKFTFANRFFWKTANITSTPVSEIMSCEANVGPFFGSIHMTFRFFADNQREIKFLWRDDAINFQRIMHGYIIANRKQIDVSEISTHQLKELLNKLGTGASD